MGGDRSKRFSDHRFTLQSRQLDGAWNARLPVEASFTSDEKVKQHVKAISNLQVIARSRNIFRLTTNDASGVTEAFK